MYARLCAGEAVAEIAASLAPLPDRAPEDWDDSRVQEAQEAKHAMVREATNAEEVRPASAMCIFKNSSKVIVAIDVLHLAPFRQELEIKRILEDEQIQLLDEQERVSEIIVIFELTYLSCDRTSHPNICAWYRTLHSIRVYLH